MSNLPTQNSDSPPVPPLSRAERLRRARSPEEQRAANIKAARPGLVIGTVTLAIGVAALAYTLDSRGLLRYRHIEVSTQNRPTVGAARLRDTVVVYTDYRCPHCQTFHFEVQPELERALAGKAKVVYLHRILFGDPSVRAAVAAECSYALGGQGAWARASDQLYAEARLRGQADTSWLTDAALRKLLRPADPARFAACQQGAAAKGEVLAESERLASQGGNSTPGVLVNGVVVQPTVRAVEGEFFRQDMRAANMLVRFR